MYINNKKVNLIKDNNKWKNNFKNSGINTFEIFFKNNIDNMYEFFNHCSNIISLDFSNFNSSNVTNMKKLFNECFKLKEIKGLNKLNSNKVNNMYGIFANCHEIEYLNILHSKELLSLQIIEKY